MKGTPSQGRRNKGSTHGICRRCGHKSFNKSKGYCSYCGFGRSKRWRKYNWAVKKAK